MDARKHREIHDVDQTKKITPLITREITFSQRVSELVFSSTYLIWIFGVQVDPIKQPITKAVDSGHVSHRGTSAIYDHFHHSFIVFKKCSTELRIEEIFRL